MGGLADQLTRRDAVQVIQSTPSLGQLRGKRLLLTGGTGFAGRWLLEVIAALNDQWPSAEHCRVFMPTRDPRRAARQAPHLAARPEFTYIAGDVRTFDAPSEACNWVIHAAAPADPHSLAHDPAGVADTIVSGTKRLLELAVHMGVERFLYVSSGAVYGPPPTRSDPAVRLSETSSGGPALDSARSAYAEAKRYAEVLCAIARERSGLPVVIARPFTFVGPYQSLDAGFAVTDFIRDGLRGKPIVIRDGNAIRSYAYGADLAAWLLTILACGQAGQVYNVGSDEPIAILTLAERIVAQLAAISVPATIQIVGEPPRLSRAAQWYVPDTGRAHDQLSLRLNVSLDDALARTIGWFNVVESVNH
ncbi:MAG: NAD-dependent epimerase/dehydratase family protein [Aggregatilineales bacterium]